MPDALTPSIVEAKLCKEIQTLCGLPAGSVNRETDLTKLGIDSLKFVSLLLVIEEAFGVNMMAIGLTPEQTKTAKAFAQAILSGHNA